MLNIIDHGKVREICLARPPVNALNQEFVSQQTAAISEATKQADAIVLSGLPGIFSAGLDVVELLPLGNEDMRDFWQAFIGLLEAIACSPVPTAAAITGHAPAGGALISLMADYRVMGSGKSKIGLNETRVGLVVPHLLQAAMSMATGSRVAEKMIVAGTLISPEQALQVNLVDALENSDEATVRHAVEWCEGLLALPRQAMLGNRAIARAPYRQLFDAHRDEGVEALTKAWFAEETQNELKTLVARLQG